MLSCCIQAIDCRQPHARVGVPRPSMCMLRSERLSKRPAAALRLLLRHVRLVLSAQPRLQVELRSRSRRRRCRCTLPPRLGRRSAPGRVRGHPALHGALHAIVDGYVLLGLWQGTRERAKWDVSASYAHRRAQPRARFAVGRAPLAPCRTAPFARLPSRRRFGRCPACSCI